MNPFNPVSSTQFQGWASFYGGNVQAPAPPPPSAFGASALGQPPTNGQYTGGWAYPDAWANFYEGKQGFTAPQNQNTPAGALAATEYANNTNSPNDPNLLGWEQAYGNPNTILAQDQNWAQSLGPAPTSTPSGQLTGGWQNPEAWAAYYGGTSGFTAPANAGSPASALAAASHIAATSNPQDNPALLGWVSDYGQPGSVLANTPNWAASLGNPAVNAQGQDVGQTNTQGWTSPLAWAAYYGGFQGFNGGAIDNTLQAAQNWAGVTNRNDPSLLGWELDYGNPQTVVSAIQSSPQYMDYRALVRQYVLARQQYVAENNVYQSDYNAYSADPTAQNYQYQFADYQQALSDYANQLVLYEGLPQGYYPQVDAERLQIETGEFNRQQAVFNQQVNAFNQQQQAAQAAQQAQQAAAQGTFNQQLAAFNAQVAAQNAQVAAQQAQVNSLLAQENTLQSQIATLDAAKQSTAAEALTHELDGIQAQLGQAQTQLQAASATPIVGPVYSPTPVTQGTPTPGGFNFSQVNPAEPAPTRPPAPVNQLGAGAADNSKIIINPNGAIFVNGQEIVQPFSAHNAASFVNQPGSGESVPSFGTNNIGGAGGEAGAAFDQNNPFNQLYGTYNTTFAQAGTAGATVGIGTPPGGPILPAFGGLGGQGAFGGGLGVDDPYMVAILNGIDLGPEPHFLGIPQDQFVGQNAAVNVLAAFGIDVGAPPITSAPVDYTGAPYADAGLGYNPNVDDYGRPIPDVGPPQPFSVPTTQDLPPLELPTSWVPPELPSATSGVNPNVTIDQVAQTLTPPPQEPTVPTLSGPQGGPLAGAPGPDLSFTEAALPPIPANYTLQPFDATQTGQFAFNPAPLTGADFVPSDFAAGAVMPWDVSGFPQGQDLGPEVQGTPQSKAQQTSQALLNKVGDQKTVGGLLQALGVDTGPGSDFIKYGGNPNAPIDLNAPLQPQINAVIGSLSAVAQPTATQNIANAFAQAGVDVPNLQYAQQNPVFDISGFPQAPQDIVDHPVPPANVGPANIPDISGFWPTPSAVSTQNVPDITTMPDIALANNPVADQMKASGVPTDVLTQAAALVRNGGNAADLAAFMAAQGYPQLGNTCAEFVSAVVTAAGGTPPPGVGIPVRPQYPGGVPLSALASQWLGAGERTSTPQGGDWIVTMNPASGQGGHVGVVESYNPDAGTVKVIQANNSAEYDVPFNAQTGTAVIGGRTYEVRTPSSPYMVPGVTTDIGAAPSQGSLEGLFDPNVPYMGFGNAPPSPPDVQGYGAYNAGEVGGGIVQQQPPAPSESTFGPGAMPVGASYPGGSFGEVPYPDLLPPVSSPQTPYFTAPPYGSELTPPSPPEQGSLGPQPEGGNYQIGWQPEADQYSPLLGTPQQFTTQGSPSVSPAPPQEGPVGGGTSDILSFLSNPLPALGGTDLYQGGYAAPTQEGQGVAASPQDVWAAAYGGPFTFGDSQNLTHGTYPHTGPVFTPGSMQEGTIYSPSKTTFFGDTPTYRDPNNIGQYNLSINAPFNNQAGYSTYFGGVSVPEAGQSNNNIVLVQAPNGQWSYQPIVDVGPHVRTGATLDVLTASLPQFGYTLGNAPQGGWQYQIQNPRGSFGGPPIINPQGGPLAGQQAYPPAGQQVY